MLCFADQQPPVLGIGDPSTSSGVTHSSTPPENEQKLWNKYSALMLKQRRNKALVPLRQTPKKNGAKRKRDDNEDHTNEDHNSFGKKELFVAKLKMVEEELAMSREQHALAIAERKQRMKNEQEQHDLRMAIMRSELQNAHRTLNIHHRRTRRHRRRTSSEETTTTNDSRWDHAVRSDMETSPAPMVALDIELVAGQPNIHVPLHTPKEEM